MRNALVGKSMGYSSAKHMDNDTCLVNKSKKEAPKKQHLTNISKI